MTAIALATNSCELGVGPISCTILLTVGESRSVQKFPLAKEILEEEEEEVVLVLVLLLARILWCVSLAN